MIIAVSSGNELRVQLNKTRVRMLDCAHWAAQMYQCGEVKDHNECSRCSEPADSHTFPRKQLAPQGSQGGQSKHAHTLGTNASARARSGQTATERRQAFKPINTNTQQGDRSPTSPPLTEAPRRASEDDGGHERQGVEDVVPQSNEGKDQRSGTDKFKLGYSIERPGGRWERETRRPRMPQPAERFTEDRRMGSAYLPPLPFLL